MAEVLVFSEKDDLAFELVSKGKDFGEALNVALAEVDLHAIDDRLVPQCPARDLGVGIGQRYQHIVEHLVDLDPHAAQLGFGFGAEQVSLVHLAFCGFADVLGVVADALDVVDTVQQDGELAGLLGGEGPL